MRMTLLSPLALGAMIFAVLAEPVVLWAAEPVRLTGAQMDAVTAGAVAVGVGASATADGSDAGTYTSTSTTVFSTPTDNVEIGSRFREGSRLLRLEHRYRCSDRVFCRGGQSHRTEQR